MEYNIENEGLLAEETSPPGLSRRQDEVEVDVPVSRKIYLLKTLVSY